MKFFLYPFEPVRVRFKWDYDEFFCRRWCREAYQSLSRHPDRVSAHEDADFFVVSFTLMCLSFVGFDRQEINLRLKRLPYWNQGKNHIVFDLTDQPYSFYCHPNVSIFKSAYHKRYYRPDTDVSIPQFPRHEFTKA